MATVSGMTPEAIAAITDDALVSASIDSTTGVFTVTTRGGQTLTVGNMDSAVKRAYPLHSIFMSASPTNPATLLGFGTWAAWGAGRMPVGFDASQTEFNATEETGGFKTHTLNEAEMPAHTHANDHDHGSFSTAVDGAHSHNFTMRESTGEVANYPPRGGGVNDGTSTTATSTHSHAIDVPPYVGSTGSKGGGAPHNNLPPYITVYMWKRTA